MNNELDDDMLNIPNRKIVFAYLILKYFFMEEVNMQIHSFFDIFIVIDELYLYLEDKEIYFDENGFPIFTEEMFLTEWPDLIIPFSQRNNKRVIDRHKTVLCFFDSDQKLYPRLYKVLNEIEDYKNFMGVIGLDITITDDMDEEWQRAIALLNQLFLAVLAVNGIKVVINTRTGGLAAESIFSTVPQGIMVASGFLGCEKIKEISDFEYLKKILLLLPDKLLIYGKHDLIAEQQLDTMGINYRVYKDFHRLCRGC